MSNDDEVLSLAAANAQIRRLRADLARYKELLMQAAASFQAERTAMRARIAELEAGNAVMFGTLERPKDDPPARYVWDVTPTAPPHDE